MQVTAPPDGWRRCEQFGDEEPPKGWETAAFDDSLWNQACLTTTRVLVSRD